MSIPSLPPPLAPEVGSEGFTADEEASTDVRERLAGSFAMTFGGRLFLDLVLLDGGSLSSTAMLTSLVRDVSATFLRREEDDWFPLTCG
jgi:hypothetical protein